MTVGGRRTDGKVGFAVNTSSCQIFSNTREEDSFWDDCTVPVVCQRGGEIGMIDDKSNNMFCS